LRRCFTSGFGEFLRELMCFGIFDVQAHFYQYRQ
jgi:hypothetical protein